MGQRGHWDRPAVARPPRPADYEYGLRGQPASGNLAGSAQAGGGTERQVPRIAQLRADLLKATKVIGRDEGWGPARRRDGVATRANYDDLAYLLHDPTESGNAD